MFLIMFLNLYIICFFLVRFFILFQRAVICIGFPAYGWVKYMRYARSNRSEVFCKIDVIIYFAKLTGEHLRQSFLLKKEAYGL